MKVLTRALWIARYAAFGLAVAGCGNLAVSSGGGSSSGRTGALTIAVTNALNAKTLAPTIDMNAASYTVTGTGPNSATFTAATTGAAVSESGLAFGSWTVVVNALNAGGTVIGTGTELAQVSTGQTTAVAVTVTPVAGTGSLSLTVSWPSAQVETPSIAASLTPALGSAQSLKFSISGSTGTYSSGPLANGYYTLALTVDDGGAAEAGAVEVVRIVTGQTTNGTYSFANVNQAGGNIQVNITTNMEDPLTVSLAGASPTMNAGGTESLSASVSNYSGNVSYVWYVDGASQSSGTSYVFGSGLGAGSYRVDAVAFAADGTRAGSATTSIQVAKPTMSAVTYDGNGATGGAVPVDSTAYANGQTVTVLGNTGSLVNPGYSFAGWTTWTASSSGGASYAGGASFAIGSGDVTLYAVWIPSALKFSSSGNAIGLTGFSTAPTGALVVPLGVTYLGYYAFQQCYGITSVALPSSLTAIRDQAFYFCSSITSVNLPAGLSSIGGQAFFSCASLASVSIPASVTSIGYLAFQCGALASIAVDPSNPCYASDSSGVLFDKAETTLIQAPETLSGSYVIPSTVVSVADYAFDAAMRMTSVTIPPSVTSIGQSAFYRAGITSVTIPGSVASIGYYAFWYCTSLASVVEQATTPPSLPAGSYAFSNGPSSLSIQVPSASLQAYKSAVGWSDYAGMLVGY
jgi:hypothetical protein